MSAILETMQKFSAAEEFFKFLQVDYDPQIVHVNRLHILKRFQQYLSTSPVAENLSEQEETSAYKALLEKAYADFVKSDAVTEKVFKVFQEKAGIQTVSIKKVKETLEERRV